MLGALALFSFAAAASSAELDALLASERAALLADAASLGPPAALSAAAVRRALRFKDSLAAGRLRTGPTISTIYGTITGVTGGNVTQFLGVPFAQQPVGQLRWKSPLPPQNWGSITATWWGPCCPQTEVNTWGLFTGMAEECLNLDIYAPSKPPPLTQPCKLTSAPLWIRSLATASEL